MTTNKEQHERASRYLVGGVNSPVRSFGSVGGHPLTYTKGAGPHVFDIEGRSYIDFVLSWGPLILGHAPLCVARALKEVVDNGWSFGAPVQGETELAQLLLDATPGFDKVRFVSSGTEATLSALRLARGATGRNGIVKFAGCYHGHVDALLVQAGSGLATFGKPSSEGISEDVASSTLVLDYNDAATVRSSLRENVHRLAAVIVEPVAGNMGVIKPHDDFVEALNETCRETGILLIVDEVLTGFRAGPKGATERFGYQPDLITYGKVIGGGLPVGAYAGPDRLMEKVSPLGSIYQAGTLSGNPLAMAAGLATLSALDASTQSQLENRTSHFASELSALFDKHKVSHCLTQTGSMLGFYLCSGPVGNFTEAQKTDTELYAKLFHAALEEGVALAPSAYEALFVSTAHCDKVLEEALGALDRALKKVT